MYCLSLLTVSYLLIVDSSDISILSSGTDEHAADRDSALHQPIALESVVSLLL